MPTQVTSPQVTLARYKDYTAGDNRQPFSGNFLAGIQIGIPYTSAVTGFGAIVVGMTSPREMCLGLYRDEAGDPGQLVVGSGPVQVSSGGQEWNVPSSLISVAPGKYWLLGLWNDSMIFSSNSSIPVTWRHSSRDFQLGLPSPSAPMGMSSTSLLPPAFYVIVTQ
jgi:hypothetical protein